MKSPSTSVTDADLVSSSEPVWATGVFVDDGVRGHRRCRSGLSALAVAVLVTTPASTSAWVIVWAAAVQVVLAPGASVVVTGQETGAGLRVVDGDGGQRRRARCS